jgi:hypothetical protein
MATNEGKKEGLVFSQVHPLTLWSYFSLSECCLASLAVTVGGASLPLSSIDPCSGRPPALLLIRLIRPRILHHYITRPATKAPTSECWD